MNILKKVALAYLILFVISQSYPQSNFKLNNNDLTFGIGTKLNIEFSTKSTTDFKFSVTGGAMYNGEIGSSFSVTPTLHAGILLFNKNVVGANQDKKWYKIQAHYFINTTAIFQLDELDFRQVDRSVPVYHFAEFTANPLLNPYKSSLSYGTNLIWVQEGNFQRVGFLNLNVKSRFQLSYYNDGGPITKWVGDKQDRYYTGGLILSYHGNIKEPINLLELSYHKYTGYQKNAFDIGEKLQIDYLNYHDKEQFKYNQQRWRINATNLENGVGGSLSVYNYGRLDLQDFLHYFIDVPFHPDYDNKLRIAFGGRYQHNN